MVSHWYLTPSRLTCIYKHSFPTCWKQCGQNGTFIHLWWSYKYISQFWSHILVFIKRITGFMVPKDPKVILLNHCESVNIPDDKKELIFLLLLATKNTIAFYWKKPTIPTMQYWLLKILDFIVLDKVVASLYLKESNDSLFVQ